MVRHDTPAIHGLAVDQGVARGFRHLLAALGIGEGVKAGGGADIGAERLDIGLIEDGLPPLDCSGSVSVLDVTGGHVRSAADAPTDE